RGRRAEPAGGGHDGVRPDPVLPLADGDPRYERDHRAYSVGPAGVRRRDRTHSQRRGAQRRLRGGGRRVPGTSATSFRLTATHLDGGLTTTATVIDSDRFGGIRFVRPPQQSQ